MPCETPPDLPPEIFRQWLGFASRKTLRECRLVSRAFNYIAEPELFRTVYLKASLESFVQLSRISHSASLRRHVRRVFYSGRLLTWDLSDFQSWREDVFRDALIRTSNGLVRIGTLLEKLSEAELHLYYHTYLYYVKGQKYIHFGDKEVTLLGEAFRNFPSLHTIKLETAHSLPASKCPDEDDYRDGGDAEDPVYDDYILNETFILPLQHDYPINFHIKRFMALLMATSYGALQVRNLDIELLDAEQMNRKLSESIPDGISDSLQGLFSLRLRINRLEPNTRPTGLKNVLICAKNLRSLGLLSHGRSRQRYFFSDRQTGVLHWPKLEKLELDGFEVVKNGLIEFLQEHASTLTDLKLADIDIRRELDESLKEGENPPGYFVDVLKFLSRSMKIKKLRLERHFGNGEDESWFAKPEDARVDSLKTKIQRYVIAGEGECPIERHYEGDEVTNLKDGHEFINWWKYEQDDTWIALPRRMSSECATEIESGL